MKNCFDKDLYRFYGEKGESFLYRMMRPPELSYIALFRKTQSVRFAPLRAFYEFRLKKLSYRTRIQIPARTQIGEGFYIGHSGRVIIHPDAKLGRNVNVGTGVTIGYENRGKRRGAPTIVGDCWIGTNAVVVGNITIGEDVLIAPLTFVNFDVPPHSVVVGNPARIIPKEHATEGYIHNRV
ncbi:MAG: serine acetyltransferase [Clostridia bacterium]|nr:serine acetyltransferase [Clostridia bacterium]